MRLDPPVAITIGAFLIVLSVGAWVPKSGDAILTCCFVIVGALNVANGIRAMLRSRTEIRKSRRGFEVIWAAPPERAEPALAMPIPLADKKPSAVSPRRRPAAHLPSPPKIKK